MPTSMKKILLLGTILLNSYILAAQHIKIQKEKSLLYITHKVEAKETLYSLGRTYHLTAKEIATANKLNADAGLRTGQQLKIPLKKTNFVQSTPKSKKDLEPVYYTIKKGDNLYKLSKNYNNVKEAELKKWNHLSKSMVKPGQDIIVGYVKVSNTASDKQEEVAAKPKSKVDTTKNVKPKTATTETDITTKPVITAPKVTEPVKTEAIIVAPQQQETIGTPTSQTSAEDSYFAANYSINAANASEKKITGTAATFKSTSGWSDRKYYVLMNDLAPETIVKVTANGKSIYAKVLESLPDLKDNKNLVCRISNAAASVLGVIDTKFEVEISFYQ
jgi:LysM repeat protein